MNKHAAFLVRLRRLVKNYTYKGKRLLMRINPDRLLTLGYNSDLPQRRLAIGYLSYILFGTILLSLPFAQKLPVSLVDNLFMVTSAISTTGLATVDISSSYTLFGEIVILALIQLGGLGYMTLTSFIMYRLTHHFMRIKNGVMRTSFAIPVEFDIYSLTKGIVYFSFVFEFIGTLVLYILFRQQNVEQPFWNAIFHSISSFCTAGFSLFSDSLIQFNTNWGINITIAALSYAGAMGFILMIDLRKKFQNHKHKLTLTSKVIFLTTSLITIFGTFQLYLFEPSFKSFNDPDRLLVSFFQTMSAMTTVGFNSVDIGKLILPSLLILIITMFIGASPSGTGGGVKSTTISAVYAFVKSKLGEKRDVILASSRLPSYRVDTALTNFIFYSAILWCGVYVLTFSENFSFQQILFEATSAIGTVGLSTGITAQFSDFGKIILSILMYIGRLGVLAFGASMLVRMSKKERNPESDNDIAI